MGEMETASSLVLTMTELLRSYNRMADGLLWLHSTLQSVLNQYGLTSEEDRIREFMVAFESDCAIEEVQATKKLIVQLKEKFRDGATCNNLDQAKLYHGFRVSGDNTHIKCNMVRSDLTLNGPQDSFYGGYTSTTDRCQHAHMSRATEVCTEFDLASRPGGHDFKAYCDVAGNFKNGECKDTDFLAQVPLGGETSRFYGKSGPSCENRENSWQGCEKLANRKGPENERKTFDFDDAKSDTRDGGINDEGYMGPWYLGEKSTGTLSDKYGPVNYHVGGPYWATNRQKKDEGKLDYYEYCSRPEENMYWCYRCEYHAPQECKDLLSMLSNDAVQALME